MDICICRGFGGQSQGRKITQPAENNFERRKMKVLPKGGRKLLNPRRKRKHLPRRRKKRRLPERNNTSPSKTENILPQYIVLEKVIIYIRELSSLRRLLLG